MVLLSEIFNIMSPRSILAGDFNAYHSAWGSSRIDHRGDLIHNSFSSLNLCLLNTGSPTRCNRPPFEDTAIDLAFSHAGLFWSLTWRVLSDPYGSDHFPILIDYFNNSSSSHISGPGKINQPLKFNFNKADWKLFSDMARTHFVACTEERDVLDKYEIFVKTIRNLAESAILVKKMSYDSSKPTSPPWWNSSCTEAVRKRSEAYRTYRRSKLVVDFIEYSKVSALTKVILKRSKRDPWRKFCLSLNSNISMSVLWSTARKFKACVDRSPRVTNEDWFLDFCEKIMPCYVPYCDESSLDMVLGQAQNSMDLGYLTNPFTLSEIKLAINTRNSLAAGVVGVFPILLKHLPDATLIILLSILNSIWHTRSFPKSWKEFRVIPIPKMGTSKASFRPIAISSVFCKVLEHMLKNRLEFFLESNNLIPKNMFGFRKGLGTMECLTSLVGENYNSFCSKEFCTAAFVDIRGAKIN